MRIGETILKLREEKKMTQEEFAQYFHVTRQTISNWEKEKSYPDLQTLVEISDKSGISVDSMLRDNFNIVQQIDKKVRHLKIFKIGTIILATIVLMGTAYFGVQNVKRTYIIQSFKTGLEAMGFEKEGNNYYLEDSDFRYEIYTFERPDIWEWNQELNPREKFVVGIYKKNDSNIKENIEVTMRKTSDFTTLIITKIQNTPDDFSRQTREYFLDKKGQINHIEGMDNEDYKIYIELQNEIKKAVNKMDEIYRELYM